ncbi:hypothetical protein RGU74_27010 [Bacillus cereus]|uniref:hypothetical protein n=1 Tax=Bacillus cereus TaxID=1396 RepID=UPI002852FBD8|nr:hypothetical protein [Bacillus cereus]MDR4987149.1 hypothetical protein [Bacillus cereus]
MTNFIKQLPEWKSKGIEPPQGIKDSGWQVAQRPPASYFDWFFNRTYEALKELQDGAASKTTLGDLLTLKTISKDTIVAAINEIKTQLDTDLSPSREGANVILKDVGNYFTTDNVEAALQEVGLGLKNTTQNLTNLSNKQVEDVLALDQKITTNKNNITTLETKVTDNTKKVDGLLEPLSVYKTLKDANGIYKTVEWKTKGGILRKKSVLSDPDANGNYLTQTITKYADNGTTVIETQVFKPTYDSDGDVMSEVLQ